MAGAAAVLLTVDTGDDGGIFDGAELEFCVAGVGVNVDGVLVKSVDCGGSDGEPKRLDGIGTGVEEKGFDDSGPVVGDADIG